MAEFDYFEELKASLEDALAYKQGDHGRCQAIDISPQIAKLQKKLQTLPTEDPDAIDLAMLAQADAVNDGSTVSLEAFLNKQESREAN